MESLPNELLFSILDYLYCDEITYAFSNLNQRMQSVLHAYSNYHLNHFDEITKLRFHSIEQSQLDMQHIKSLKLSDNINILEDNQSRVLLYPIEIFYPKLQMLSLINTNPGETISLIHLLPNFQQLKFLSISHDNFTANDPQMCQIILFQIKTLKHFIWNIRQSFFDEMPTITSEDQSTIEYYEFCSLHISELEWLNSHTSRLKSIRISYPDYFCRSHSQQTFDSLVSLSLDHITSINDITDIEYFLKHLPGLANLKKLVLQGPCWLGTRLADGSIWEKLIKETVPQLKIFEFFFTLNDPLDSTKRDKLIDSFRTDFWLIEKQWFITCDYEASCGSTYFYTLPCIRSVLDYSHSRKQFSTRTRTIDDTKTIRQLNLYAIKSQQIESFDRLNYVQTLSINSINHDVSLDQLNQIVNMSSVIHIDLRSKIDEELFKFSCQCVSLEIDYDLLKNYGQQFKNIKSLEVRRQKRSFFDNEDLQTLHYYFPNLEKLVLKRSIELSNIKYLLNTFHWLSLLVVGFQDSSTELDLQIPNKNIIYQRYNNTLWFLIQRKKPTCSNE